MAKLFMVTCTLNYLTVEDDENDARANAVPYAREHLSDAAKPLDVVKVTEIQKKSEVPREWLNAIPYGDASDGAKRVSGYLQEEPRT